MSSPSKRTGEPMWVGDDDHKAIEEQQKRRTREDNKFWNEHNKKNQRDRKVNREITPLA